MNLSDENFFDLPVSVVREPAQWTCPFVFNSPHSGRYYPAAFLAQTRLDRVSIRKSEDMFVDELFAHALHAGAPLHLANFPRAYVDVNREPFELDPRMFDGDLPPQTNLSSARVASGLGSIPRIVGEGVEIYAGRLPVCEATNRIEQVYKPFHRQLRLLLNSAYRKFGRVILVDCHSMPSIVRVPGFEATPDVVVGDRFGLSASRDIVEAAVLCLRDLGFSVVYNKPYAGGFITEHYGRPARGYHALQIEINRGLYLDEKRHVLGPGFGQLQTALGRFAVTFADAIKHVPGDRQLAAE